MNNTDSSQYQDLTLLGKSASPIPGSPDEAVLESFGNPSPDRDYWITFDCPEFTSLCPVTNQPDFGHITIRYIPAARCLESKSLKLYLFSFRNHNPFHEAAVNRIMDDIVNTCNPKEIAVDGDFNPRGGISIKVNCKWSRNE